MMVSVVDSFGKYKNPTPPVLQQGPVVLPGVWSGKNPNVTSPALVLLLGVTDHANQLLN